MGRSTIVLLILFSVLVRSGVSKVICEGYPPHSHPDEKNGTIFCSANACLVAWHTITLPNNETFHKIISKGCFMNEEEEDRKLCHDECIQQPLSPGMKNRNVSGYCCCTQDLCNANITFKYYPPENATDAVILTNDSGVSSKFSSTTIAIVVLCVLFLVVASIMAGAILWMFKFRKKPHYTPTSLIEKEPLGPSMDLGKLTLEQRIGQGKYGTVWKGMLNDRVVAVKIFPSEHRQFWLSEKQLFTTGYTHKNILKYIGAEEHQKDDGPEYLLLTEYHAFGSLMDFLKNNTITWKEMCQLSQSAAAGLAYLHQDGKEDFVGGDKLSYVHRDFNSRNLLVNSDKTCVLADFGFAMQVSGLGNMKAEDGPFVAEVGTLRYMAPEVLDGAVNLHDLQSALKQIDVYAQALVIWEIAMRCTDLFGNQPVPEYKLPFERELGPVEQENLNVYVVQNKSRPRFPDAWKHNHLGVRSLKETIEDCWDQDPDARLTALCVQERLMELANHYPDGPNLSTAGSTVQLPFQKNFKGSHSTSQGNLSSPSDKVMMVVSMSDSGRGRSTEMTTV